MILGNNAKSWDCSHRVYLIIFQFTYVLVSLHPSEKIFYAGLKFVALGCNPSRNIFTFCEMQRSKMFLRERCWEWKWSKSLSERILLIKLREFLLNSIFHRGFGIRKSNERFFYESGIKMGLKLDGFRFIIFLDVLLVFLKNLIALS